MSTRVMTTWCSVTRAVSQGHAPALGAWVEQAQRGASATARWMGRTLTGRWLGVEETLQGAPRSAAREGQATPALGLEPRQRHRGFDLGCAVRSLKGRSAELGRS